MSASNPRTIRFLSADDVRRALPMIEAVEAMKSAFRELSENRVVVPMRAHVPVPEHKGDILIMPAYSPATAMGKADQSLGVSASTTGNVGWGVIHCAAKAFIKFTEPKAELDEIETRISSAKITEGIWKVTLQSK